MSWCYCCSNFPTSPGSCVFPVKVLFKAAFLRTAAETHLLQLQEVNSITSLSFLLSLFSLSSYLLSMFRMFLACQSVYYFHCISFSVSVCPSMCFWKDLTMRNVSSDLCLVAIANKRQLRVIVHKQNTNGIQTQIIQSKSSSLEPLKLEFSRLKGAIFSNTYNIPVSLSLPVQMSCMWFFSCFGCWLSSYP